MLRIVVLGAAAGGGVPQWNCGCPVCVKARRENPELKSTQASIAFSADGEHWFLVNASPDLRQQLTATPQLHPKAGKLRHSPIAGVILTNGEVDLVNSFVRDHSNWQDHTPPQWTSTWNIHDWPEIVKEMGEKARLDAKQSDLVLRFVLAARAK